MRRILALAAVSGLAITGLTGTPAAADSTIQVDPDVVINEVGIDVTEGSVTDINYVELRNTTMTTGLDIDGWQIKSCAADGSILGTTVIGAQISDPTTIDDFRLAGDNNYALSNFQSSAPRDYVLDGTNGGGLDAGGGVAIFNATPALVHSVIFTDLATADPDLLDCLAANVIAPEESPSPNVTSKSAQRSTPSGVVSWGLADPTPRAAN